MYTLSYLEICFLLFSVATNKPLKKKVKKSQSANTRPPIKTDDSSSMVQRILSANRNKITKLYNTVEELQQEVDNLRQENRTLKRVHVKQEREIKKIEKAEASLPQLLHRHSAELRTYREQLKKNKMDRSKKEKESHHNDVEILKLKDKLQHYKSLDDDKKLEERAALARRLEKVENDLSERDRKITVN
jgi:TolA-binding protein